MREWVRKLQANAAVTAEKDQRQNAAEKWIHRTPKTISPRPALELRKPRPGNDAAYRCAAKQIEMLANRMTNLGFDGFQGFRCI